MARQEDNMDRISNIREKQKQLSGNRWFPAARFAYDLLISLAAVLPLMVLVIKTVPFSYEINDDTLIAQFLDGSYTGSPEAHAFYVRYPLSWIIAKLYEHFPAGGANWYVLTIAALMVFAMVCVLFRMLRAFSCNRLVLCMAFDTAVGVLWLPHFSCMTFTTAAAFMGVMGILFLGFMDEEETAKPLNLLVLAVLLAACWCLRRQCFLMVIPFIAVLLIFRFRLRFFCSWQPWLAVIVIGLMAFGIVHADKAAYGTEDWQTYRTYNSERSWLQDYGRIPPYEGNEEFYQGIDMGKDAVSAFKGYTYCMVEGFGPDKVHAIYEYVSSQQAEDDPSGSLLQRVREMIPAALETFMNPENISVWTVRITHALWVCLIPILLLSLLTVREDRWRKSAVLLLEMLSMGILLAGEWIYLMMLGRFPRRIEEIIWLLTFCIGVLLSGRILMRWKDIKWCRLPGLIQIVLLVLFLMHDPLPDAVSALKDQQAEKLSGQSRKAELLEYCGEHPENLYVLRTTSFPGSSTPYDDLHQGNWFMSGSWAAYSPLYNKKLAAEGTTDLGADFLQRDNVYVITKGKANLRRMTGRSEDEPLAADVADTVTTRDGTEYLIYKVH